MLQSITNWYDLSTLGAEEQAKIKTPDKVALVNTLVNRPADYWGKYLTMQLLMLRIDQYVCFRADICDS